MDGPGAAAAEDTTSTGDVLRDESIHRAQQRHINAAPEPVPPTIAGPVAWSGAGASQGVLSPLQETLANTAVDASPESDSTAGVPEVHLCMHSSAET
jgi:hypothetical protein